MAVAMEIYVVNKVDVGNNSDDVDEDNGMEMIKKSATAHAHHKPKFHTLAHVYTVMKQLHQHQHQQQKILTFR